MPLQNRVTPFGELVAVPQRGLFMGNRGCLHDDARRLTGRRFTTRAWLICLLSFRGRRRTPMSPGRYTELFFLDEATGLAAGHRPCAECRRADFNRFKGAWLAANGNLLEGAPTPDGRIAVGRLDAVLHAERMALQAAEPATRTVPQVALDALPDGVMVTLDDPREAFLVHGSGLYRWTPGGYASPRLRPRGMTVGVLTPGSTVRAIATGYAPVLHPSAQAG
ncbi:MAG: hypothetical protein HY342_02540 [Candidatus Lambdaproteobacteria bacterium]|nr:hypothetical protein [Candidatus Lambdaproteobacteria bacterium]